jgi:hypothetical protein
LHQGFTLLAGEQIIFTNQGVQIIDQGVQSGFSDFHGSALVPCGGWVQSRFSCSGPEIVSQFLQRVPLTPG